MRSTIDLPFAIGDRLYHAVFLSKGRSGIPAATIERYTNTVSGVQMDKDGSPKPVINGCAVEFNTIDAASTKKAVLAALAKEFPGAIYLDKTAKKEAFYASPMGIHGRTQLAQTTAAIKRHVHSPVVTDGPAKDTFLIQSDYTYGSHGDDPVSAFQLDSLGRVTDVICSPFLYIMTRMRPDGLREIIDLPDGPLPYAEPMSIPENAQSAYSPRHWTVAEDMTVESFCELLQQRFPKHARISIQGMPSVVMHYDKYKNKIELDNDERAGLPEYGGHEPYRAADSDDADDCIDSYDDYDDYDDE